MYEMVIHGKDLVIKKDGDQWCAHRGDFINPQESISGWGDTEIKALHDLIIEEEEEWRKMVECQCK